VGVSFFSEHSVYHQVKALKTKK